MWNNPCSHLSSFSFFSCFLILFYLWIVTHLLFIQTLFWPPTFSFSSFLLTSSTFFLHFFFSFSFLLFANWSQDHFGLQEPDGLGPQTNFGWTLRSPKIIHINLCKFFLSILAYSFFKTLHIKLSILRYITLNIFYWFFKTVSLFLYTTITIHSFSSSLGHVNK